MTIYRIIKIKGDYARRIGWWVRNMYRMEFDRFTWDNLGWRYVKERLSGWTIWYVTTEEDYAKAIETLNDLQKTHLFVYEVMD